MKPLRGVVGKTRRDMLWNANIRESYGVSSVLNTIETQLSFDSSNIWEGWGEKKLQEDAGSGCQVEEDQEEDRERHGKTQLKKLSVDMACPTSEVWRRRRP